MGREAELYSLSNLFGDQSKARPRVAVISRGAGVSKSRLAAEYAHQSGGKGFWSTAGVGVEQTLAALAPDLDVEVIDRTEEETAGEVQPLLEKGASSSVLETLANLFRVSQCRTAIT